MIKKYFKTDFMEVVQYTGDNYKEISEFVSPSGCKQKKGLLGKYLIITIDKKAMSLSMIVAKGNYITKGCNGLCVFDEERLKNYSEYDEKPCNYSKIGSISIGKSGAGIDLNWPVLDRNYNGNIDLYIKEKNNED
jgi:hypothetical protein